MRCTRPPPKRPWLAGRGRLRRAPILNRRTSRLLDCRAASHSIAFRRNGSSAKRARGLTPRAALLSSESVRHRVAITTRRFFDTSAAALRNCITRQAAAGSRPRGTRSQKTASSRRIRSHTWGSSREYEYDDDDRVIRCVAHGVHADQPWEKTFDLSRSR